MNELQKAREIINRVDREMADLFEERMDAVKLVTQYKKENGIPADDFGREEEIIKKKVRKLLFPYPLIGYKNQSARSTLIWSSSSCF